MVRAAGRWVWLSARSRAELAAAPGGILLAKSDHRGLDGGGSLGGRPVRGARVILQAAGPASSVAAEPLIGRGSADPEPAAELRQLGSPGGGETDELGSFGHGR
jgi:hypothetical protein